MVQGVAGSATERSDAELIGAVRSGDSSAFGTLFERHSEAVRRVARIYSRDHFSADDLVSDAFAKTMAAIQGGGGPDVAFRAYIYTTVRRLAADQGDRDARTVTTDDFTPFDVGLEFSDPAVDSFENRIVASAFASLPERWQAALWYLEVEQLSPAELAPILGLTANGVSALGFRAREGLRQAYLQAHVAPVADDCEDARSRLGAYARGALAKREKLDVEQHLDGCAECRAVLVELRDVGHGLRVVIAPLILGGVAASSIFGMGSAQPAAAAPLGRGQRAHRMSARRLVLVAGATVLVAASVVATAALLPRWLGAASLTPIASEPAPTPSDPAAPSPTITPSPAPTVTATPTPEPTQPPTARDHQRTQPKPPVVPPVVPPIIPVVPAQLALALEDTGDLVLGRGGIVGTTVSNPGTVVANAVTVDFSLPPGVTLDSSRLAPMPLPAGWICTPVATGVECTVAALPAGATVNLRLPLVVDDAADTTTAVAVAAAAAGVHLATAAAASGVVAHGFGASLILDGAYSIEQVGASMLSCNPIEVGCTDAQARTGSSSGFDNNGWAMTAVSNSSTTLGLPAGSTVTSATLYWSAFAPLGATEPQLASSTLTGPGGVATPIVASRVDSVVSGANTAYQAKADVTALVASTGSGSWQLSGAQFETGVGTYGGWSLVVVVHDPSAASSRVAVFDGHALVEPGASAEFDVAVVAGSATTFGVVAWEGDGATTGDSLLVDGVPVTPASAHGSPFNAFDSTADGYAFSNSFGVDVKRFAPHNTVASRATVTATTAGDVYLVGVVTAESK